MKRLLAARSKESASQKCAHSTRPPLRRSSGVLQRWGFALLLGGRNYAVICVFALFELSVDAALVEAGSIEKMPSAIPRLISRVFIMVGVVTAQLAAGALDEQTPAAVRSKSYPGEAKLS